MLQIAMGDQCGMHKTMSMPHLHQGYKAVGIFKIRRGFLETVLVSYAPYLQRRERNLKVTTWGACLMSMAV